MSAIRLARGFTGRTKIVKFAGCYHGHVDALLAAAGSGVATLGLPDSPGVTGAAAERDDRAAVQRRGRGRGGVRRERRRHRRRHHRGGGRQHGRGRAARRLQRRLAEIAHAHGALLILDEVMTGFRVSRGGWAGLEPVDADLFTFGKVMGGGLPAAAFGGRAEIMSRLAPAGPVYQAGTLSGNPLACAAGLATLRLADDALYARLDETAATVGGLATDALADGGCAAPAVVRGQHVLDLLHRRRGRRLRRRRSTQDVGRVQGVLPRDAGAAASTCRRARSRRGSSRPRSTTRRWSTIAAALPDAARAAAAAAGAGAHERADRRSCTCCGTVRCTTRTRSCTVGCPASSLSELGGQMAKAAAQALADRDVTHVVASPLERAQETAEPIAGAVRAARSRPTTG